MSADDEAAGMMCCASCGQAEVDDIKLKMCNDGCDLVKYCSGNCRENHREQHEEECKKRKAELRDRDLFAMPDERCYGECPICCLPLPINVKNVFMSCCSKWICRGCDYANQKREFEAGLENICAFCREPMPKSDEEASKKTMKRIKKHNCPAAMVHMGKKRRNDGDYETAFKYFTKATELGDVDAHFNLSNLFWTGEGVEKDKEKEVYHLEEAAIGGHPHARHNLGCEELENGRYERAKKHFIIAANLGYQDSLNELREGYATGHASKEDYADALRAYQAALDETKSAERKVAEAYYKARDAARLS
jgi:tetratricopeptide (TPR) repeat protein